MKRIRAKLIEFLKQGLTPRDLALTLALGVSLGTFPVIGSTSLLCAGAGLLLRLNQPVVQSVNWAASPLQLALLIPFFNMGAWLFGGAGVTLTLSELIVRMQTDLLTTVSEFLWITAKAIGVWALAAPLAASVVFMITLPILSRLHMEYVGIRSRA